MTKTNLNLKLQDRQSDLERRQWVRDIVMCIVMCIVCIYLTWAVADVAYQVRALMVVAYMHNPDPFMGTRSGPEFVYPVCNQTEEWNNSSNYTVYNQTEEWNNSSNHTDPSNNTDPSTAQCIKWCENIWNLNTKWSFNKAANKWEPRDCLEQCNSLDE